MDGDARRVLIVEDHEFGREGLRVLLELNGHEVREADDGPRGLMLAISWQPDVVKPFEAAALEELVASRLPRGPANEDAGG